MNNRMFEALIENIEGLFDIGLVNEDTYEEFIKFLEGDCQDFGEMTNWEEDREHEENPLLNPKYLPPLFEKGFSAKVEGLDENIFKYLEAEWKIQEDF